MGLINFGVPIKETDFIKSVLDLDVFVEGGTYQGGTAKSMSSIFKQVYTIEKSDIMYELAKENLKDISNIVMLKGDTREHLKNILEVEENILFWLDAHWSGGDTYGADDECPLIEELELIFKFKKNYVILIDDARLFLSPPPLPHRIENWPNLNDLFNVIPKEWDLIILEDVIYIFPKKIDTELKKFIQERVTDLSIKYVKDNKNSIFRGVKIAILGLLKGNLI